MTATSCEVCVYFVCVCYVCVCVCVYVCVPIVCSCGWVVECGCGVQAKMREQVKEVTSVSACVWNVDISRQQE